MLDQRKEALKNREFVSSNEIIPIEDIIKDRLELDRDVKVPPPRRNPFTKIDNLEEILKREQEEQDRKEGNFSRKERREGAESEEELITHSQYHSIYNDIFTKADPDDADLMLLKLK